MTREKKRDRQNMLQLDRLQIQRKIDICGHSGGKTVMRISKLVTKKTKLEVQLNCRGEETFKFLEVILDPRLTWNQLLDRTKLQVNKLDMVACLQENITQFTELLKPDILWKNEHQACSQIIRRQPLTSTSPSKS